MNVLSLAKPKSQESKELLAEALELAPDEVVVVMFKDGEVITRGTYMQCSKMVGALEIAKYDLLKGHK